MARDRGILVVFDLVSTLADAGPRYVQAFADVLESRGLAVPPVADVAALLGNKNLSDITDQFAGPLPPDEKKAFMADCNAACDALLNRPGWREELFPNVREAIETMHLRGFTLGIYTGTREDALAAQLNYHHLGGMFDTRYMRGKDNTRDANLKSEALKVGQLGSIVEAFNREQGKNAAGIIVIGDSAADVQAAASLGLHFVGFASDDKKSQQMQDAGAQSIVRDFGDLPDLVQRLLRPAANDAATKPSPGRKLAP
ncbi:MAG: HAD hydrolase-like protein [Micavibrio sp.]|nr:HAD hydrolase-like protein [Micavibrio sp.]